MTTATAETTFTDCEEVKYSNLKKVYYDRDRQCLHVEFHNGSIAGSRNVSYTVYTDLINAVSVLYIQTSLMRRRANLDTDGRVVMIRSV